MKKIKNSIKYFLIITIISVSTPLLFSQGTPPPPPDTQGESGDQGRGAPIGGGLFILLGLGAAYGGKKVYDLRKNKLEE